MGRLTKSVGAKDSGKPLMATRTDRRNGSEFRGSGSCLYPRNQALIRTKAMVMVDGACRFPRICAGYERVGFRSRD